MTMRSIRVTDLSKSYQTAEGGDLRVLDEVSLSVPAGSFFSLLGPSGCGKSTLLNVVAGLTDADGGTVTLPDDDRLGFVFQEPRLLEWKTVEANLAFALDGTDIPTDEYDRRIRDVLALVGLEDVSREYPRSLSRGMQQRVAIARAFCIEPDVLLMDEPFASVDEITARELRNDLIELWRMNEVTVLFVTHDVREAITLADVVAIFSQKPTDVEATVEIETPRPREPDDEATWQYYERILSILDGTRAGASPEEERG